MIHAIAIRVTTTREIMLPATTMSASDVLPVAILATMLVPSTIHKANMSSKASMMSVRSHPRAGEMRISRGTVVLCGSSSSEI